YGWTDVVLYALGIGAQADDLDYLYEGRGPKVYPSFAVIPAYPAMTSALAATEGPFDKIVHGAQKVLVHAPIPASGSLKTTAPLPASGSPKPPAVVEGIYDLRRMAQAVVRTRTVEASSNAPLFDTEWSILYLGEGGFGGVARPEDAKTPTPARASDFQVEQKS